MLVQRRYKNATSSCFCWDNYTVIKRFVGTSIWWSNHHKKRLKFENKLQYDKLIFTFTI